MKHHTCDRDAWEPVTIPMIGPILPPPARKGVVRRMFDLIAWVVVAVVFYRAARMFLGI